MPFQTGTIDAFLAGCQIGDCLHWWGGSPLSKAIEAATHGGPSHVAMVRDPGDRTLAGVKLVESTQVEVPKKFIGVVERPFGDELGDYQNERGSGVWCPIRTEIRANVNWANWGGAADSQVGNPYDYTRMVTEAYNAFVTAHHLLLIAEIANRIAANNAHHSEFCSELWCFLYFWAHVLSPSRVPSLTAPLNSLQAAIYGPGVQILGAPLASDFGYNSVSP